MYKQVRNEKFKGVAHAITFRMFASQAQKLRTLRVSHHSRASGTHQPLLVPSPSRMIVQKRKRNLNPDSWDQHVLAVHAVSAHHWTSIRVFIHVVDVAGGVVTMCSQ